MNREHIVLLHGFTQLDSETQEHCDSDSPDCDGWCAVVRVETPDNPREPFTLLADTERDFSTLESARASIEPIPTLVRQRGSFCILPLHGLGQPA